MGGEQLILHIIMCINAFIFVHDKKITPFIRSPKARKALKNGDSRRDYREWHAFCMPLFHARHIHNILIANANTLSHPIIHKILQSGSCVIMDKETRLLQYINRLEQTNVILLEGLKQCHTLLSSIAEIVPDPYGWQNLLQEFEAMIQVAEKEKKENLGRQVNFPANKAGHQKAKAN